MTRLDLLDSNVYIRAFRDSAFGAELQDFHNIADFTLIARHLEFAFVQSFPPSPAV